MRSRFALLNERQQIYPGRIYTARVAYTLNSTATKRRAPHRNIYFNKKKKAKRAEEISNEGGHGPPIGVRPSSDPQKKNIKKFGKPVAIEGSGAIHVGRIRFSTEKNASFAAPGAKSLSGTGRVLSSPVAPPAFGRASVDPR
jgi:hypothetical protein